MTVSLVQWRAVIGIFNTGVPENPIIIDTKWPEIIFLWLKALYVFVFLKCHGDMGYWAESRSKKIQEKSPLYLPLESYFFNCTRFLKTYAVKSV